MEMIEFQKSGFNRNKNIEISDQDQINGLDLGLDQTKIENYCEREWIEQKKTRKEKSKAIEEF
jgi:hypothetical protein